MLRNAMVHKQCSVCSIYILSEKGARLHSFNCGQASRGPLRWKFLDVKFPTVSVQISSNERDICFAQPDVSRTKGYLSRTNEAAMSFSLSLKKRRRGNSPDSERAELKAETIEINLGSREASDSGINTHFAAKVNSCEEKAVLPSERQKFFEDYLNDPLSQQRWIKFLHTDIESHCLSSRNPCDSRKFLDALKLIDSDAFLCGLRNFVLNKAQGPIPLSAVNDVDKTHATPGRVCTSVIDEKSPHMVNQEIVGHNTNTRHTANSSAKALDTNSRKQKIFNVGQREFECAYDCVLSNEESKKRQIVKVGQILFDCVFHMTEIRHNTLRGEKGKPKFNPEKIRFINTTAWLITKPSKRSIEAFKISEAQDLRLKFEENEILKKVVFTEYAYKRCSRLKCNL